MVKQTANDKLLFRSQEFGFSLWVLIIFLFSSLVYADRISNAHDSLERSKSISYQDGYTYTQVSYQCDATGNIKAKYVSAQMQGREGFHLSNLEAHEIETDLALTNTNGYGVSNGNEVASGTEYLAFENYLKAASTVGSWVVGGAFLVLVYIRMIKKKKVSFLLLFFCFSGGIQFFQCSSVQAYPYESYIIENSNFTTLHYCGHYSNNIDAVMATVYCDDSMWNPRWWRSSYVDGDVIVNIIGQHEGGTYRYTTYSTEIPAAIADPDIEYGENPEERSVNCDQQYAGNPINILNGNKIEKETDILLPSSFEDQLVFLRYYNSQSAEISSIGRGWTHNFHLKLYQNFNNTPYLIKILDETGRGHYFEDSDNDFVFEEFFSGVSRVVNNSNGELLWERGGEEYRFDSVSGNLLSVTDKGGNHISVSYDEYSGLLMALKDRGSSRTITFHYNEDDRIDYISGPVTTAVPDGVWVSYEYDINGNLTKVIYADDGNGSSASGFEYRYEDANDANNLTAKYDLEGHLLSSWTYDASDRAVSNSNTKGTGVKNIDYSDSAAVVVTDAYDIAQTYHIEEIAGRKKIIEKSNSQSCGTCASGIKATQFDPETGYPVRREYVNGRIDLFQDYDDNGNAGIHVVASGSPLEKIIEKTWHPILSAPLMITQKSVLTDDTNPDRSRITIWDYDDPSAAGDSDIPNENPTNLIHRMILRGYTQDASGAVVAFEQMTVYTYSEKGQLLSVNGPLAGDEDTVTFGYDSATGDLVSVTRPLTGTVTFTHDAAGNTLTVTDENQIVTTFTYDGKNRQTSETMDGATSRSTYTAAGSPATLTDRVGRTRTLSYNTWGLLQRLLDPAGNYYQYAYDENGNRTEVSIYSAQGVQQLFSGQDYGDPSSDPTLSPGKPAKNLAKSQDGSVILETLLGYEYGNLTQITDPAGTVTELSYDIMGRLVSKSEPQTETVTASTDNAYDLDGNLVQVTDPEGKITQFVFDDAGRKVKEVCPDTGTTRSVYDIAGNLIQKVMNDGVVTGFTYDVLGRLTGILYPDEPYDIVFFYDEGINGKGRLTGISQADETYTFSYDTAGRMIRSERITDLISFVTTYEYDSSGLLTDMAYPDGRSVTYERDAAGNITRVTTTKDGSFQVLTEEVAYRPFGPLATMTLGSGQQVTKTFDLNYRPVSINALGILEQSLTYDVVGRITGITDLLDSSRDQSFGYDLAGRLLSAQGPYGSLTFTYDKTGNRLSRTLDGDHSESLIYGYEPGSNLLNRITGDGTQTDLTYDTNGRPLTRGEFGFSYNSAGQVASISKTGSPVGQYLYNYLGLRTSKEVGDKTTLYHYDLWGNLIGESTESGDFFMDYIYLDGNRLAGLPSDPNDILSVSVSGSTCGPLEGVRVYAFNESGNYIGVNAVTDASGTAVFQKSQLAGTAYTFRADYLNEKFWSGIISPDSDEASILIEEADQAVSVIQNGEAVIGVHVYVFDESDRYLGLSGITDALGRVVFSLPEGQEYKFRADVLGLSFFSSTAIANGETQVTIDTQGGTLTFSLTMGNGISLTGIKTYVFSSGGLYLGKSATTNDEGIALFDLPAGMYKIRCDYLGYKFWSDEISLTGSQSATLDIPHRAVSLAIVKALGSDETPATGIPTFLFSETGSYLGVSHETDDNGQAVYLLPEKEFKIRGDYLGNEYWSEAFTWSEPVITIPQGQIRLSVTGTAEPLAGIKVYAFSQDGTYLGINAVTDDQGTALFALPQGNYTFRVDYMDSKYWSQSLAVTGGQVSEAVLSTGGGILTAIVRKNNGTILSGIKTYLFTASGSYLGLSSVTDDNGEVSFSASKGEYKIRLDYLGYKFWSDSVSLAGDTTLETVIPHTPVTGLVFAANSDQTRAIEDVKVYLFSEAGTYMGLNAVADSDGKVLFSLPEKAYKLRADYLGSQYWSESFAGSDTSVTIPEGRALVTVGTEDHPIQGIKVYVFSGDSYTGLNSVTDGEGVAEFNLPQGTWRFRADYMGAKFWGAGAVLADQNNPVAIDPGNTSLALTVEKTADHPLEGVNVYAFTAAGAYIGLLKTTSDTGLVNFDLPRGEYQFRADYLGYKFWTGNLALPDVSSETLSIPHRDVTFTIQGESENTFPLSGIKTYLFTEAGAYQSLTATSNSNGSVVFSLPEKAYKLRADYLGIQLWSESTTWEDKAVTFGHGAVNLSVTQAGTALPSVRVYVFSPSGTYLGQSIATDSAGTASLTLPVNTYKLRIDYSGSKYWTQEIDLIRGQAVDLDYDLDTLSLNLTANPHYARYDGEMPQKKEAAVLLASIGSLAGYYTSPDQPDTMYYINDHLGTPLKVIDNDNQVVWDGWYLPFGTVQDGAGLAQNPFRFPGQYFDGETGLHYNWHRYYDPETGRYITPDPIGLAGGINPFVYVQNDPVNMVDPEGLVGLKIGKIVGTWIAKKSKQWFISKILKLPAEQTGKKIAKDILDRYEGDGTTDNSPEQMEMDMDTDNDGLNDYFDPDDDNDGIPDDFDDTPKTPENSSTCN